MCDVCGCGDPQRVSIDVHERILAANDHTAAHNRAHFLGRGTLAVNLMGSPGSGKTALLEATRRAAPDLRLGAVSGDLATDHDARRLAAAGIPSWTITTGTACHLDAGMVHRVLHELPEAPFDVFVVENVGNLVCPALYDLGQAVNVVALATTEGVDKPLKYPVMFRAADLVLLTKTDLLPHLPGTDPEEVRAALARVTPRPSLLPVSATSGEGLAAWIAWLRARRAALPAPDAHRAAHGHAHAQDPPHAHGHPHAHAGPERSS
jgi:hydrogenase nickel incorporation protein HypB